MSNEGIFMIIIAFAVIACFFAIKADIAEEDVQWLERKNRDMQYELDEVTRLIEEDFSLRMDAMNSAQKMLREANKCRRLPAAKHDDFWSGKGL